MRFLSVAMILMLGSVLGAQTGAPAQNNAVPKGDAANGKKIFASYGCYQCHGYAAQGGVGPRLAPRLLAFAAFSKYLRQPAGEMPPYTAKVLSNSQLADVYAFLRSLPPPPGD